MPDILEPLPEITVVVTVFNQQRYIQPALTSIVHQEFDDLEVVCIDDTSTDQSLRILKENAAIDRRIRIIENIKNLGPGPSRN